MKLSRIITIFLIINIGLSCIFFIPKKPEIKPSAIILDLPNKINLWSGTSRDPVKRVVEILGTDTKFEMKYYHKYSSYTHKQIDTLDTSIVLSGHDMNRSIHRAERCLKAQGFTLQKQDKINIPIKNNKQLSLKKIISYLPLKNNKHIKQATYYWFVGHDSTTNDHYKRALIDIKDRILKGYDQQWGYISINITLSEIKFDRGYSKPEYTEKESDEMIKEFINSVFDKIHNLDQLNI